MLEHELVHYADVIDPLAARLDTSALRGLLPPSAMGHAIAELRERDAIGQLAEVEADVVQVRRELGYPPLITPLTEIMATQAVYNVVEGDRYATISQEIKDYCLGLYGDPPEPIDREVRRLVRARLDRRPRGPRRRRHLLHDGLHRRAQPAHHRHRAGRRRARSSAAATIARTSPLVAAGTALVAGVMTILMGVVGELPARARHRPRAQRVRRRSAIASCPR